MIEHLGGAMARVGTEETAFSTRDAPYECVVMAAWTEPSESDGHIAWADRLWHATRPDATGAGYLNYLGNVGEERVRAAYGANYDRLAKLKAKYDPSNLFCVNQNIKPQF
jgi:FAD/FMN-containing dehydrogenase